MVDVKFLCKFFIKESQFCMLQSNQRRSLDAYFNISYQQKEVQVTLCNLHLASYSPFWHIILTQALVLSYLLNVLWSTSKYSINGKKFFTSSYTFTAELNIAQVLTFFSFRISNTFSQYSNTCEHGRLIFLYKKKSILS